MLLSNRVAIITGGSKGIGKGIALKYAEEGCSIVIADIIEEAATQTVADISGLNQETFFVPCDVSNSNQVEDMVKWTIHKFGQIDILVNNAGTGAIPRLIGEISEAEWERVLAINLKGVFLCCKAVLPFMKERKYGKIVNISSLSAISPIHPINYTSSKGGVLALTIAIAMEVAPYNICVNAILPGTTRTDMIDIRIPSGVDKDQYYGQIGKTVIPMGRVGTPQDIAGAALFLASNLSDYVTGDRIIVAGGAPWRSHL